MSDTIDRLNTALEGRYRIERQLGEGGMATVYLADDLKHDRKVAIKVLKPELAAVIGGERFVTEIKTTAALQHPNILPLFDSGEADGFLYYVMPYVEGESLREKLDREKQLAVDEAVKIAVSVANALHAAHRQGVVHRDIKPANILMQARQPVVADFGIALAISAAGGGRLTETGMSLGTPHYMSPEQASAEDDLGPRSDLYALACVLYEMLTGDPPHTGPNTQSVLMRILTEEPRELDSVRKSVPSNVAGAVAKALEKLPADRFASAEEFGRALGNPAFRYERSGSTAVAGSGGEGHGRSTGTGWGRWKLIALTAIPALAIGISLGRALTTDPPEAISYRVTLDDVRPVPFSGVTVSPRGTVAYLAMTDDSTAIPQLFYMDRPFAIRSPGSSAPRILAGTEGGLDGVFSPDGEWFAYRAGAETDARVQPTVKVSAAGGAPVPLWTGTRERPWPLFPLAWSEDDWIYGPLMMTNLGRTGIGRVRGSGGEIESVLELAGSEESAEGTGILQVQNVTLLPGDHTVLFDYGPVRGLDDVRVLSVDIDSGDTTTVVQGWGPQWSPSGHLIFARESLLYAAPFDPRSAELTGDPVPLGLDLQAHNRWPRHFQLSPEGPLAYMTGIRDWAEAYRLTLVGEDEKEVLPVQASIGWMISSLSPGGDSVAYTSVADVLVQDLSVGSVRRISVEELGAATVAWSPDGGELAIGSTEEPGLLIQNLAEEAPPRRIEVEGFVNPTDWLDDGRILAEWRDSGTTENVDLVLIDPEDGRTEPLLNAGWVERGGQLSPDGRWISYESHRSGRGHFYVRSFPGLDSELRLSRQPSTGADPYLRRGIQWASEGLAAHFIEGDAVVRVRFGVVDGELEILEREEITNAGRWDQLNDVHPDGRVLLGQITTAAGTAELPRLHVVTDMVSELRRLFDGAR